MAGMEATAVEKSVRVGGFDEEFHVQSVCTLKVTALEGSGVQEVDLGVMDFWFDCNGSVMCI